MPEALKFQITGDPAQAERAFSDIEKALDKLATSTEKVGTTSGAAFKKLTAAQHAYAQKSKAWAALDIRSNKDIQREISKVQAAYKRLEKGGTLSQSELSRASRKTKQRVKELNQELKGSSQATSNLSGNIGRLVGATAVFYAITRSVAAAENAIVKKQAAIMGLESVAKHAGIGVQESLVAALELSSDGMLSNAESAKALQNLLARGFSLDEAVTMLGRFKDSAAFGRQASLKLGEAVVSATEGIKNENSILVDNAGITKNVSVMWKDYATELGVGVNSLTIAQKRQAEYNGILRESEAQVGNAKRAAEGLQGAQARATKAATDAAELWGDRLTPALKAYHEASSDVMGVVGDMAEYLPEIAVGVTAIATQMAIGKIQASAWAMSIGAGTITMASATLAAKSLGKALLPLAAAQGVFQIFELGTEVMSAYAAKQNVAASEAHGAARATDIYRKSLAPFREELEGIGIKLKDINWRNIESVGGALNKLNKSRKDAAGGGDVAAYMQAIAAGADKAEARIIALAQAEANLVGTGPTPNTGSPANPLDPTVAAQALQDAQAFGATLLATFDDTFTKTSAKYNETWQALVATHGEGSAQVLQLEGAYQSFLDETWAKQDADETARSEKKIAAEKARAENVISIQSAKYERMNQAASLADMGDEARALAKRDIDLLAMEEERQRLVDQHTWTDELEVQYHEARVNREQAASTRILAIKKSEFTAQMALEKAASAARYDLTSSGLGAVAALVEGRGKKAFEFAKVLRAGEVVVSTAASMQKAYESQLAIPTPDAPFRASAAAGVAFLKGAAHLAAINSAKMGGGSIPSSGGGGSTPSPATISAAVPTTNAQYQEQLKYDTTQINGRLGEAANVYINVDMSGVIATQEFLDGAVTDVVKLVAPDATKDRIENDNYVLISKGTAQDSVLTGT